MVSDGAQHERTTDRITDQATLDRLELLELVQVAPPLKLYVALAVAGDIAAAELLTALRSLEGFPVADLRSTFDSLERAARSGA